MLTRQLPATARQRGLALFIALIVLVPMTLAAIALTRSVDTQGIISGNMAFRQSAAYSADIGIETAIAWLEANKGSNLQANNFAQGYAAYRQDPAAGQTWEQFWTNVLLPAGQVLSTGQDTAGNTIAYSIQRMCNALGSPNSGATGCSLPQSTLSTNNSYGSNKVKLQYSNQIYYRITVRVDGPRNTKVYVQVVVAI